jgi:hypothetical protein
MSNIKKAIERIDVNIDALQEYIARQVKTMSYARNNDQRLATNTLAEVAKMNLDQLIQIRKLLTEELAALKEELE